MTSDPDSSAISCIRRPQRPRGGTGMRRQGLLVSLVLTLLVSIPSAITGCGGTQMPSNTPTPTPDFSLGVSPATASVMGGAAGQSISVTASAMNGFAAAVTVSPGGLPAGVTAKPATLTLMPGVAQNITFAADASVATGAATVMLTGTSGTLSHSATVALTTTAVPPPPDFSLMVTPTSQTLVQGTTGTALSLQATAMNGFA